MAAVQQLAAELAVSAVVSRSELSDRVRRVLPLVIADHRWPDPQLLPQQLPAYVGAVLKAHPLTRYDRTTSIRVQGAVAAYCWNYLPDVSWRLLAVETDEDDSAPPLLWAGRDGVVADRIYVGVHRSTDAIAGASWTWASEWSEQMPTAITAVRVLPLAQQPLARLVTAAGVRPLAGSAYDAIGGVWR